VGDNHDGDRLDQCQGNACRPFGPAAEKRDEQHERHDAEILENQYSQDGLTMGGVNFAGIRLQFHDDGGTGESCQEAEKGSLFRRVSRQGGNCRRGRYGDDNLQSAAEENHLPDAHQFLEGELDTDGEEEENNPDLCQLFHLVSAAYQGEGMGSGDHAGGKEADYGRQRQLPGQQHRENGQTKEYFYVLQGSVMHVTDSSAADTFFADKSPWLAPLFL